jgi:hypothetical protein
MRIWLKFYHRERRERRVFLDRITGFFCFRDFNQLGVLGKFCSQSKLCHKALPSSTRPYKTAFL